ncbi:hypothetical protein EYF80_026694 [Liparis tanakae]|uniref:Uncharacterized protein n=1 Tax=Liparis tanakae TaxID=230148 RepID=A0A4Z2HB26_9TELE|nr:hypothetical protein EYF80_026694 [Liparis tanakae]
MRLLKPHAPTWTRTTDAQAAVALCGAIKFPNSQDSESLDELFPRRRTEAVANGNAHPSSQKRLAENFLLTTTVTPKSKHWPTPMMSLTVEALLEGVLRWVFGRALQQGVQVLGVQVLGLEAAELLFTVRLTTAEQNHPHVPTISHLRPEDHRPSTGHADTVQEGVLSKVVVYERSLYADHSQTQPQCHHHGTALHVQGHHVSLGPPLGQRPSDMQELPGTPPDHEEPQPRQQAAESGEREQAVRPHRHRPSHCKGRVVLGERRLTWPGGSVNKGKSTVATSRLVLDNSQVELSEDPIDFGEVRVEAGELLGQPPDGDDEEDDIEDDDEAHGTVETPDEAVLRQPAARGGRRKHVVTEMDNSRYDDDKEGSSVTREEQVERPNAGVEHQDHHAVQLHPF